MPELKELWLSILFIVIPIIAFMFYKKGSGTFSANIAETYGKKTIGAGSSHISTWLGTAIIILSVIIVLAVFIFIHYLSNKF